MSFIASQYLKTFLVRSESKYAPFEETDDKGCQHLEDPHNSVTQYYPNDRCTRLQNQTWLKVPFKVEDRPGWDQG